MYVLVPVVPLCDKHAAGLVSEKGRPPAGRVCAARAYAGVWASMDRNASARQTRAGSKRGESACTVVQTLQGGWQQAQGGEDDLMQEVAAVLVSARPGRQCLSGLGGRALAVCSPHARAREQPVDAHDRGMNGCACRPAGPCLTLGPTVDEDALQRPGVIPRLPGIAAR